MTSSLAASTLALSSPGSLAAAPASGRQFYELRKYTLSTGPQMTKQVDTYVAEALIPALNRLQISPVGAFHLDFGPETPTLYLLLPCTSSETLVNLEHLLAQDAAYLQGASSFLNASTSEPLFHRMERSLLQAFEGFPIVHPPASAAAHGKRIFQLRTYESPTPAAHLRKVEMFHHGEFEIFSRTGLDAVFYAQTLIGNRMPSLTYMVTFPDLATLMTNWDKFRVDPAWKKLSSDPRYATDTLVSNITNLILSPADYSQI